MKCSNFYYIVKQVKRHEQAELAKALKAHGGSFSFENDDVDNPIIAVNLDNYEPEPQDVLVNSASLDEHGDIVLSCTGKLDGEKYNVDPNDVFAGHLEYVTSSIPPTDEVDDVTLSVGDFERTVWMRLGANVCGTKEEIDAVVGGDEETLKRLVKEGKFKVGGDSYIPEQIIKMYNEQYGTQFDPGDVGFEW